MSQAPKNGTPLWLVPIFIVLLPIFLLLSSIFYGRQLILGIQVMFSWRPRGTRGVLAYSQHVEWSDWAEEFAKQEKLLALPWEKRMEWNSLARQIFYAFARTNRKWKEDKVSERKKLFPVVVVFGKRFWPRVVFFKKAWQAQAEGSDVLLEETEELVRNR